MDALLGGRNHYDASNANAGYTIDGLLGESHYDRRGKKVGYSTDSLFGESTVLFEDDDTCNDDW